MVDDLQYPFQSADRIRRIRRVDDGDLRRPFIPYGIIPVGGLALILLFSATQCASNTQDKTQAAAQFALREAGLDWATAKANGQHITLSGKPPSDTEAAKAIKVVTEQKWDALLSPFLGKARPVTRVTASWNEAVAAPAVPAPGIRPPASSANNDWAFRLNNKKLTLEGRVPDADTRNQIVNVANANRSFGTYSAIENKLTTGNGPAPSGYQSAAIRGISVITRCNRGSAVSSDAVFSINCFAVPERVETLRDEAASQLLYGVMGAVDVRPESTAADCDQALADILNFSKIEFATNSAAISLASREVLDRIAEAASSCPGTLRIEGYTDSDGTAAQNDNLSQKRADAVRAALINRGIEGIRLTAEGYGERNPVAENSTQAGKARNRRIEIRVAGAPD